MAPETTDVVVVAPSGPASPSGSYLEWGSILGGAVLSVAITTLLTTFGSAIGLSLVSFEPSRSTGLTALAIAGALWVLWVTVTASAAGGYMAGRMRRPAADASRHERHVRDGSHGLIVWAVGALLVAALAASSVAGVARTAAAGAASAATTASAALSQQPDPMATAVDMLTRATGTEPVTQAERDEASRIVVRSLRAVGIDARERFIDASVFWGARDNGEFDLLMYTPASEPSPSKPWSRHNPARTGETRRAWQRERRRAESIARQEREAQIRPMPRAGSALPPMSRREALEEDLAQARALAEIEARRIGGKRAASRLAEFEQRELRWIGTTVSHIAREGTRGG